MERKRGCVNRDTRDAKGVFSRLPDSLTKFEPTNGLSAQGLSEPSTFTSAGCQKRHKGYSPAPKIAHGSTSFSKLKLPSPSRLLLRTSLPPPEHARRGPKLSPRLRALTAVHLSWRLAIGALRIHPLGWERVRT